MIKRYEKIPDVKKIAILRANALGDFMFALPALYALKETYQEAEIVYLGKPWHKTFLENRPSPLDRIIVVPESKGIRGGEDREDDIKGLRHFFAEMQKEKFDIAIQLHGGGRHSNTFVKNLKAKVTVGLRTPDAETLDLWLPYVYYQSEIMRYLEVVHLIGAKTPDLSPKLSLTHSDREEARHVLSSSSKPYIIIHPGSTDVKRRWPTTYFAQVGDYLAHQGYRILITGITPEKEIVDKVISLMKEKGENMCDMVSMGGLAGLIEKAELIISNDTGPLHLASAIGTKAIGLYWCGNLITGMHMRYGNFRPLLSWITICPLCKKDIASHYPFEKGECTHETSFITGITVDEVIKTSEELLEQR